MMCMFSLAYLRQGARVIQSDLITTKQISYLHNDTSRHLALFCSLENWYYRILVFLTGYVKNAELAVDALSIW
jgi:hypothetical protein